MSGDLIETLVKALHLAKDHAEREDEVLDIVDDALSAALPFLSTLPIAAGKIVAWRTFNEDGTSDVTERQDIADQWTSDGFEVSPLVVASTLPIAVEGKVKALEWVEGAPGTYKEIAESPFGHYSVWEINGTACWSPWKAGSGTIVKGGLAGAKAAAQSDYETRILSALISSPGKDGGQEVEAGRAAEFLSRYEALISDSKYRTANALLKDEGVSIIRALATQPDSTALVERLTKALEPFAKAVEKADATAERMGFAPSFDAYSTEWAFTFRDLREARSAIAALKAQSPSSDPAASEGWPDELKDYDEAARNFVERVRTMLGAGYGLGHHMPDLMRVLLARNEAWERLSQAAIYAAKGSGQ